MRALTSCPSARKVGWTSVKVSLVSELPGTILELQSWLKEGKLSASESLKVQRERLVHEANLQNGFVEVFEEREARVSSHAPLHGVGLAHKDIFELDLRSPGIGLGPGQSHPGTLLKNSTCIEALHQAGASHFGTLHMAPYACGSTAQNEYLGACLNPLNASCVVGGSSSGSAVAVARELCFASLGTDTAGSIRIPAASCGLVGLKTSMGLLSTLGVHPLAPHLDTVGILARSVDDLEQVLVQIKSHEPVEQHVHASVLKEAQDGSRIHCWFPSNQMSSSVATQMLECVQSQKDALITEDFNEESSLSAMAEVLLYQQVFQTHRGLLSEDSSSSPCPKALRELICLGAVLPKAWSVEALTSRSESLKRFVERYLKDRDFFMLPALGVDLPTADQVSVGHVQFDAKKLLSLHRFMGFVNYLGLPSLLLPIGQDSRGLPVSVQVLCRPFEELSLLRWAKNFIGERFGTQCVTRLFTSTA